MTCKYDKDIQCFSDCPECVRARGVVICTGCQQAIGSCEDCYTVDDEIYCSECIEEVTEDIFHQMPLSEKLEIAGANRMMWEG